MSKDETKPLTREEVRAWPALGMMRVDPDRVLALIAERDHYVSMLDMTEAMRARAEAERDLAQAMHAEASRQRDELAEQLERMKR